MRRIYNTRQFRRDFKRLKRSEHAAHIDQTLSEVLKMLSTDTILPKHYVDHAMKGEFKDCRDCHLRGDLVLIYRKSGDDRLELVRIGSHASLEL